MSATSETANRWRLIVDEAPRSGAANMAIDQAIAEACAAGTSITTLRFYAWHPPAVSLGRHQASADVDRAVAEALGYEIVRRPTGGRAILHTDELTYSVAGSDQDPHLTGGVMDSYLHLSEALVASLHLLEVQDVEKAGGHVRTPRDVSAACFETPSAYEIVAGGRKLIGSAQSRRAGYVLQHGSLPLVGDITRLIDALALPAEERQALRQELAARACTLAQALAVPEDNWRLSFAHVAQMMQNGFQQTLNISLQAALLTAAELRRAAELIREQYANPEWTAYR
jgi:lipoate-protein ligase A